MAAMASAEVPAAKVAEVPYTVFYWTSAEKFRGRAFAPIAILEEAGAAYDLKAPDDPARPGGTFAAPIIASPSGAQVAQVPAICRTLGHELGLAPEDPAADAKALQICCDAVDFVSEADKEGKVEGERKQKWLAHFDTLLKDDHPVNYSVKRSGPIPEIIH